MLLEFVNIHSSRIPPLTRCVVPIKALLERDQPKNPKENERAIYSKSPNGLSIRLFTFQITNSKRTIDGGQLRMYARHCSHLVIRDLLSHSHSSE